MAPHAKPWRVLVSEVMLQQIQVKHAILSYERLLARFATVEALAEGPPAEVPGVVAEEGRFMVPGRRSRHWSRG